MDRFEKHAEYIMERGEKLLAEKKRRNNSIRRIAFGSSGFIAAVIVCFFAWKLIPASGDISSDFILPEITETITASDTEVTAGKNEPITTTSSAASDNGIKNTVTETADNKTSLPSTTVSGDGSGSEAEQTRAATTALQAIVTTAQTDETATPLTTAEQGSEAITEVFWGYNDYYDPDNSPAPIQNIAMKCKSFCAAGEKLRVDVAMADAGLRSVNYDKAGDYKYEVAVCDPTDYKNVEDKNFIVNGEHKRYRKEFSKGDVGSFDINGKLDDYDSYHHETTEIDFTDYEVGSSGCIKFTFKLECKDDPLHMSYTTANQYMFFYVDEKGTYISNKEIEYVHNEAQPAAPDRKDDFSSGGRHDHRFFDSEVK